ncbi:sensor histidine kinase [Nocardiopsis sp. NPDC058631]|uniref:sensor histidine kinase n=1 Tax=Nocardiopsis sp. NPDC058631 TaxID=3346566 RepID=UPI0036679894
MRTFPATIPPGLAALACSVLVALSALVWPLLFLLLPFPALLTGRLSSDPRPAVAVYATGVAGGAGWLLLSGQPLGLWITGGALVLFAVPLPWLVGLYLRNAAALEEAGWDRARILESEARLVAERVRLRERSRIAGDLHDAVGHELSLLSLRAGALEMAGDLSERRRSEAAELREAAARAADRLAEALGVLRVDGETAPLGPADDSLTALVERSRSSGMEVVLSQEGDTRGLPVLVDRAVYRVVQESLTNAARHAPGAVVRVTVGTEAGEVLVRVVGSAPGKGFPRAHGVSGGTGLASLRERVRLVGGTFHAGPEGPGWAVSARVPLRGRPHPGAAQAQDEHAEPSGLSTHRLARRRTAWAIGLIVGVPVAAALLGYGLALAFTAHQAATATLEPEVFERLRPGQDRAEVEAVLPENRLDAASDGGEENGTRPGLECGLYRSSPQIFDGDHDRYRLCFDSGTLVSAEVVTW